MLSRPLLWVAITLSLGACGGDDDDSASEPTRWQSIPTGNTAQSAERQSLCEQKCALDGSCGLWDATTCADDCDDPRRACQAGLTTADCWARYVTWQQCVLGLSCAELDQYHFHASEPNRPCTTELDAYSAACPDSDTAFYQECFGTDLVCDPAVPADTVPAYWVCDGEADCSNAADEADCPWLTAP